MPTRVVVADTFARAAFKLRKRYPRIFLDIKSLRIQLELGETPGDRLQSLEHRVYKVRVRNSDVQRGKSGGYRVIYYLETQDEVILLTIYSKSDQSDVPTDTIRRIIEDYLSD